MHAVIFDIDGTLVQSVEVDESLYVKAIRSVLGQVEFRSGWADYENVTDTGILLQVLADNTMPLRDDDIHEIEHVFVESLNAYISKHGPFAEVPGARKYCQSLRESADHSVAMATGAWRSSALAKLESAGFETGVIPLATCNDSTSRTEIMEEALSKIGTGFDSITYYGDGSWDEKACAELGWNFVAVGAVLGGLESYFGESFLIRRGDVKPRLRIQQ